MRIKPSPSLVASGAVDEDLIEMAAYCDKHTPAEFLLDLKEGEVVSPSIQREISRQQRRISRPMLQLEPEVVPTVIVLTSSAPTKKNLLLNLDHLVPHRIFQSVFDGTDRERIHKRREVVTAICKYWALKREAGRGAPLIKRLQIEVCFFYGTYNIAVGEYNSQDYTRANCRDAETDGGVA
jgi:hypothetical protein